MSTDSKTQTDKYRVVVNHEEQYSLWPTGLDLPLGWREDGKTGTKAECLSYVNTIWVDMRPSSLRERLSN